MLHALFFFPYALPVVSSWSNGAMPHVRPSFSQLAFLQAIYEHLGQIDRPEFSRPGKVKAAICALD
jgi:hypothetical protein